MAGNLIWVLASLRMTRPQEDVKGNEMTLSWAEIAQAKRRELEYCSRRYPLTLLSALAEEAPAVQSPYVMFCLGSFRPKLAADLGRRFAGTDKMPKDYDLTSWSQHMQRRGAAVLVVSTDHDMFGGSIEDLKAMRTEFDGPIIRRDFIVDEYQIYESRAAGADSFTLHVGLHDVPSLQYHLELGRELGMEALILAQTEAELQLAADTDALMIGLTLREDNLHRGLTVLKQLSKSDPRLCTLVDAIYMSQTRMQQFALKEFHSVVYSHRSLRYEFEAQITSQKASQDQIKD